MTHAPALSYAPHFKEKVRPVSNEPQKITVTPGHLGACGVPAVHVAHQSYPEMRVTDTEVRQAAERLALRLASDLDAVSSPACRKRGLLALDDIRAFLETTPRRPPS